MNLTRYDDPFEYYVIDDFLDNEQAISLSNDFADFNSPHWFTYDNPLEVKKTLNNWYHFPPDTYKFFNYLNSVEFLNRIKSITNFDDLHIDTGLHGAGWHIHGNGGKLNVHLDYSLHPKLNLQRKFNFILYLSQDWNSEWGGNLEFWSHNEETKRPKEKRAVIECKFNRVILFDASKNSWHGFNDPINCPENIYRKSIASYYLTTPSSEIENRKRALFSPSDNQKDNNEVLNLINIRKT